MFRSPTRWPAVRRAGRPASWVATARLSSGGIYATRTVHWAMAAASGLCPGPLRSNVTSRQHAGMCSATCRALY
eukprot:2576979-Alexandrium_andersonii.AAC.1